MMVSAETIAADLSAANILRDFYIACLSREASLLARREVLTGKAKFGITGDGKEVPQLAMARAFAKGDFRSGYYRDQTFLFALGLATVDDFFAQLYADPDNDPFSGGRQMNGHYASPLIDQAGHWLRQAEQYNVSADISSTGGQMARALGLALASQKYRQLPGMGPEGLSAGGNEVSFCTIGDASTSEGVFWETINAAGVMQVPLAVFVWDDGYGISVPIQYQTTKSSISEVLSGFTADEKAAGWSIYREKGWNYPALVSLFRKAIGHMRETHQPALFHIDELTQPQGHSTSGSHERYKSAERLAWEKEYDCIEQMAHWMVSEQLATEAEIEQLRADARRDAREARDRAWRKFNHKAQETRSRLLALYQQLGEADAAVNELRQEVTAHTHPLLSELVQNVRRLANHLGRLRQPAHAAARQFAEQLLQQNKSAYGRHLYAENAGSALRVPQVPAVYSESSPYKNGFEILNAFFDKALNRYPNLFAFGEDVGHIGGVNQAFSGMQAKYGVQRVFDTGIREWTIMGQAIGMAMRGLRPIAEIQYLDYLIYGLEPLSDDLATLRWRSNGQQKAPAIIRTRGHRLEGIWHAGSPMGMIVHALRGMYVCVPRNMTQAAGMYNTLLQSDEPGLIVECLNGYRLKERLPDNVGDYTVPLGVPEILRQGNDVSLVTYGSCVRIAEAACDMLARYGISVELIDAQTLLPFDLHARIADSVKKTNRVVFLDEDVPGGASAYMMQQVLEMQQAYQFLDSAPVTITAAAHRPPYGSDGDYFSKPSAEDVFQRVYQLMSEADPARFIPFGS
jgi:pyruvate/2-oxoglutarate/acetoin dehydrogenase E1 component/TPP-dependent pyruvate/acetoin dehydrogenase alpha subunit